MQPCSQTTLLVRLPARLLSRQTNQVPRRENRPPPGRMPVTCRGPSPAGSGQGLPVPAQPGVQQEVRPRAMQARQSVTATSGLAGRAGRSRLALHHAPACHPRSDGSGKVLAGAQAALRARRHKCRPVPLRLAALLLPGTGTQITWQQPEPRRSIPGPNAKVLVCKQSQKAKANNSPSTPPSGRGASWSSGPPWLTVQPLAPAGHWSWGHACPRDGPHYALAAAHPVPRRSSFRGARLLPGE